jgi:hypothetical protein
VSTHSPIPTPEPPTAPTDAVERAGDAPEVVRAAPAILAAERAAGGRAANKRKAVNAAVDGDRGRSRPTPRVAVFVSLLGHASLGSMLCGLALAGNASAAERSFATSHAVSDNWAGYAVTARAPFRRVVGAWTQPAVTCGQAPHRYSAFWVGLGGFTQHSRGLEQIGTEADCTGHHAAAYAWYELLPAGEVTVPLKIRPGDHMTASVATGAGIAMLHLHDLTTGKSYGKGVAMAAPDTSSAEWIAEAPSICGEGARQCHTLPLANFSSVTFSAASATTRNAPALPVGSPSFHATALTLQGGGVGFGAPGHAIISSSGGQASPGALAESGSSFTVTWEPGTAPPTAALPPEALPPAEAPG